MFAGNFSRIPVWALVASLFLFACVATCLAQNAEPAAPPPPKVFTHSYDIHDLLTELRSYPLDSNVVPPTRMTESRNANRSGWGYDDRGPTRKELVDEIIKLIQETVAPDSWKDAGGPWGAIREVNGVLIITQTQENHDAVVRVLKELRSVSQHPVTVVATIVSMTPDEVRQFTKPVKIADGPGGVVEIDLAALTKSREQALIYRSQITGFNRQTVHLASGQARTVLYDLTPIVGGASTAFDPEVALVQDGISLELTPLQSADGTSTLVDLHAVISKWNSPPVSKPAPLTTPSKTPLAPTTDAIDRIDISVQQMRTTVIVPSGKSILAGGLTQPGKANPDSTALPVFIVLEILGPNQP